jgi:hypothetical protein
LELSTGWIDAQTIEEGTGGRRPGKPKEEAFLQEQNHRVVEEKGNLLGSAIILGIDVVVVVVVDSTGIVGCAAVDSSCLLFLP